ncbi:MAG: hypothetical protein Kow00124_22910 [Anaerolineae bacterium]
MVDRLTEWEETFEDGAPDITRADRFSSILVVVVAVGAVLLGLFLRQQASNEQWTFVSREAGIEAMYPAGWITARGGGYVARISNPIARPYKTQYIISVVPFSPQSSVRNVLDNLTIQRSNDLSAYRVLSIDEVNLGGAALTEMSFAFVDADPNPFIQRLPVVVQGRDVVIVDGNRAIIVTFMSEQSRFEENLPDFQRFLSSLRY